MATPVPASVKTDVIEAAVANTQRTLSGVLLVAEETRLSFAVGGKLLKVALREGESFTANQLIAQLDPADFIREVTAQKARMAAATSRLRDAEDIFRSKEKLGQTGVISRAEVSRVEAALASARSDWEVASVALATAEENLRRTTLVAPLNGIVTRLLAKQFEDIAASQPVYEVGTGDTFEALFLVPESLVSNIQLNAPVDIMMPGLGDGVVQGHIIEISAGVEAGNAFRVRARLNKTPDGARSGMTANVKLAVGGAMIGEMPIFTLPVSALAFDSTETGPIVGRKASVFVLDKSKGIVNRREIAVRGITGNRVLVSDGLIQGERVVTAGVAFLRDGQAARPWIPPE